MPDAVHHYRAPDGTRLAYRDLGAGRPLVLLHGVFSDGRFWLDHGPGRRLAQQRRVIVPDFRAHGASDTTIDYPPDVLAHDIEMLLDDYDDYDLAGYSLGGKVALRLLARGARPGKAIIAGQGLGALAAPGPDNVNLRILATLAEGGPIDRSSPDAATAMWITASGGDPVALAALIRSVGATDPDELRHVDVPVLVVNGSDDPRAQTGADLAALFPHATARQIPGDHYYAAATPEFDHAVSEFLR